MIFVLNIDVDSSGIVDGWEDCVEDVISLAVVVKLREIEWVCGLGAVFPTKAGNGCSSLFAGWFSKFHLPAQGRDGLSAVVVGD